MNAKIARERETYMNTSAGMSQYKYYAGMKGYILHGKDAHITIYILRGNERIHITREGEGIN